MRLGHVFRFEIAYTLRRTATWVYGAVLFGAAFAMIAGSAGRGLAHVNAPAGLAELSVFVGFFGILVTAALVSDAATRDVEAEMEALLVTTPLSRVEYLGGRLLAALAANGIALAGIPLGLAAATLTYHNAEQFGPFEMRAYAEPFLLFLVPNLAIVGLVLYTIAALSRQTVPVYLGATGLCAGYLVALNLGSLAESPTLALLTDPLGVGALLRLTGFWTVAERNLQFVGFPPVLVWNRVVWGAIGVASLCVLLVRFRFEQRGDGGSRATRKRQTGIEVASSDVVAVPRTAGSFGPRTAARQTIAVAANSLEEITGGRAFAAALLGVIGFVLLWGWNVGDTAFDTTTWPVTFLVAETVLSVRIQPIVFLLIAVYAGELVWKDRHVGVAEIADAAPVTEGVVLLGRFLALVAIVAAIQAACIAGGVLIQVLQGFYKVDVGLYLRIVFGLTFLDRVLLAALAMTVHVLVNQKYLGHLVVLAAFAFTVVPGQAGIHHRLLVYGSDPGWTYSDMNGLGPFAGPFIWFKLYWGAWALLLAVLASLFWVRGREPAPRRRLQAARARFTGPTARVAAAATLLILLLGGFIFYNTNILNAYRTPDRAGLPQAEYERRYKRFEHVRQPAIADAELRVEIYPEEPAVDIRGAYRLLNRSGAAIDSVHVFIDPAVDARSIAFDRAAAAVLTDHEVGYRVYALDPALEPGGSLRLRFDVSFRPRGFPNSGIQTNVVRNGAYFDRRWMPIVGYQPALELSDASARRDAGLPPRPRLPGADDVDARRYRTVLRDADLVQVDAIVGTSADQIAVTPGVARRSWTANGRRYFHYRTDAPTLFGGSVFSARYAVLEDRWTPPAGAGRPVDLRIYHHPGHRYVLDRMVRSMKASLDYYTRQFGAYPDRELRILEIPRYGTFFGRAHPQTIAVTEDNFLTRVRDGDVDQASYGIAHEVAHQWWPGQVMGAMVRGHAFLSESLANYSAMMVTERLHGADAARMVYDHQMHRYLSGRAFQSREVPLLDVEDQPYIAYRKGAIAMYALRERIGEERVNTALRGYLERHRGAGPPYPTSRDLYAELRAVTPGPLRDVLEDLFETITLWDVRTESAAAEPTGSGTYLLELVVVASKRRADGTGRETEIPMDDFVEVGAFDVAKGAGAGEPLYLQRHRIRSGRQTIRITLPRRPARAGIDPRRTLIDRVGADNVVEVKVASHRRDGSAR